MPAHGLSQRRAYRLADLNLSTWQYRSIKQLVKGLRERIVELAGERRRFGYRRLYILLRREGWVINHKAIHRIYREEGLQVRKRKRKWIGPADRQPIELPQKINERWSKNFVLDVLSNGRRTIEEWRIDYNTRKPHSSRGYLTPIEYAQQGNYRAEELST